MKEGIGGSRRGSHVDGPAIQVICLGSGGGPSEDNVTGFLVRSIASNWAKSSVLAVDAGSHLAAITRILEKDFPLVSERKQQASNGDDLHSSPIGNDYDDTPEAKLIDPTTTLSDGPFAGLSFPHASARANALHIVRDHVSTYLITHPHLDHISGFIINTAAFHNTSKPKKLAALPFTVNSIKTHIFNDIIWPNLTDEDGGVGFVTFQRLAEGGNIALGEGPGRGFIEVCDGLGAKGFKVSHGHCMRGPGHVHRGSTANLAETSSGAHNAQPIQTNTQQYRGVDGREGRSMSFSYPVSSNPGTPLYTGQAQQESLGAGVCVIDSTAYFIRANATSTTPAREILIFGDVEPDSISLSPRTHIVWSEAAPKIATGTLKGIFIECSYNDSQADAVLFGHVAPRHLIQELEALGSKVHEARRELEKEKEEARKGRKRKRVSNGVVGRGGTPEVRVEDTGSVKLARRASKSAEGGQNGNGNGVDETMNDYPARNAQGQSGRQGAHASAPSAMDAVALVPSDEQKALLLDPPLLGVKVVIIHVKDTLADGPLVGESILQQLEEYEGDLQDQGKGLGCEFAISKSGASHFF